MRRFTAILLLMLSLLLSSTAVKAQGGEPKKKETPANLKKAATDLERSLIENDNSKIARNYELLSQEFDDKDDLPKAEEYLFKALEIYTAANDIAGRAKMMRKIARVQEHQGKLRAAAQNYNAAATTAIDKTAKTLNLNDYNRLKNQGNPQIEESYLNANISLLNKQRKKAEVADTYMQLAALNLKGSDTTATLQNYELALGQAKNYPVKAIKIYSEIAKLHVAAKRYEEAVTVVKELLEDAKALKNYNTQIVQLQYLASIYFKMDDAENGVNALKESYKIASANGKTFEAKETVILLIDHYKATGDDKASMEMYEEFFKNLDRIILSDTSLTDAKTFRVTEERIRRLETEKSFKDELITRKNTFNYLLLGFMVLLLLLFAFIVKALYSIKTKNKEIALQSLRREMNPHFIFNSLNSVNQFIAQNNELEANKYLTSYSNLMRNTMENSNKDFVTLGNEIENLTKYLELEHLRFKDKFRFEIKVDEKLDPDTIWVPNMIVQPHLENAIWHGLRYKEERGVLKMTVELAGKKILITIDDDGIGPTKSGELKTHNQKAHNSRGLTNTKERMTLLNELYKTNMAFTVTEKTAPETGTIVEITFPIINKP
ncbi:tetratricopeptide repeat-containing sensor histidine kinase [Flavobacterium subsaxonicum]|uniref:Regulator of cell autolysis n=1 Tax=Flavobacterium subsaxonicum WB 4.1-42 = DSM 21790 TaxID=1121898 RepID=A0A0A2MNT7_9FLAO|nr:histidine kinase [Flavobacterium subsaxonicum]KGO93201.1 regulator of cell autolysis [Flavobacterium subsaxonicum WB 4.1-42 = DSM 21790]